MKILGVRFERWALFLILFVSTIGCVAGCASSSTPAPAVEYMNSVRAFREQFVMPWIARDPDLRGPDGASKLQSIQDAIASQAQYETLVLPPVAPATTETPP